MKRIAIALVVIASAAAARSDDPGVAVYLDLSPGVVRIHRDGLHSNGSQCNDDGSGLLIDDKGDVLSAAHLVADKDCSGSEYSGSTGPNPADTDHASELKVVKIDSVNDLALFQFTHPPKGARPLSINFGGPVPGQRIFILGFPEGGESFALTINSGILSGPSGDYLKTDAPINPGNSGGPMVDSNGQVVGIVHEVKRKASSGVILDGVGFVVKTENVSRILPSGYRAVPSPDLDAIKTALSQQQDYIDHVIKSGWRKVCNTRVPKGWDVLSDTANQNLTITPGAGDFFSTYSFQEVVQQSNQSLSEFRKAKWNESHPHEQSDAIVAEEDPKSKIDLNTIDVSVAYQLEDGTELGDYSMPINTDANSGTRTASLNVMPVVEGDEYFAPLPIVKYTCSSDSMLNLQTFGRLCRTVVEATTKQENNMDALNCPDIKSSQGDPDEVMPGVEPTAMPVAAPANPPLQKALPVAAPKALSFWERCTSFLSNLISKLAMVLHAATTRIEQAF